MKKYLLLVVLLVLPFNAFALNIEHRQQSAYTAIQNVASATFVVNCPNRNMTITKIHWWGKHEKTSSAAIVVKYNGITSTTTLPYPYAYQQISITLPTPVTCQAGNIVSFEISSPGTTFRYLDRTQTSSSYPTNMADTKMYISTDAERLIYGGITEYVPITYNVASSSSSGGSGGGSSATSTVVTNSYSESQTLFYGFVIFFLSFFAVIYTIRRYPR